MPVWLAQRIVKNVSSWQEHEPPGHQNLSPRLILMPAPATIKHRPAPLEFFVLNIKDKDLAQSQSHSLERVSLTNVKFDIQSEWVTLQITRLARRRNQDSTVFRGPPIGSGYLLRKLQRGEMDYVSDRFRCHRWQNLQQLFMRRQ